MRWSVSTALFILLCGASWLCALGENATLYKYDCVVQKLNEHEAKVSVALQWVPPGNRAQLEAVIGRWANQNISELEAKDRHGAPLNVRSRELPGAVRLIFPPIGESSLVLSYMASSNQELNIVPLPVPNALPVAGQYPVTLSLQLPFGNEPVGDAFPVMQWSSRDRGSVQLPSVPSLLLAGSKSSIAATNLDRWMSSGSVANTTMVLLLIVGSLVWWTRTKRSPAPKTSMAELCEDGSDS